MASIALVALLQDAADQHGVHNGSGNRGCPGKIHAAAARAILNIFKDILLVPTSVFNMAGPIQIGDIIKFSEIALEVWKYGWEAEHNAG